MCKFTIIGLGLIGGSIAKTLKCKINCEIVAIDSDTKSLSKAFSDGTIDYFSNELSDDVKGSEIVFVCTTVSAIVNYLCKLPQYIDENCIVTDVGSTKENIMKAAKKIEGITFIGGHPMTGSERSGYIAATDILFQNAYYILTPRKGTSENVINKMTEIIKLLGGLPIVMDVETHDVVVSAISHAPHVIAAALVNTVECYSKESNDGYIEQLAAGGFKDITRIASSSPAMWSQISLENKQNLLQFIRQFKKALEQFENQLVSTNKENLYSFFSEAKDYRDRFLLSGAINGMSREHKILMDVHDKPGMIAAVSTILSKENINIKNIGIINNREYEGGVMHILLDNAADVTKSKDILQKEFEGTKIWI